MISPEPGTPRHDAQHRGDEHGHTSGGGEAAAMPGLLGGMSMTAHRISLLKGN
jgi:hypothetical protein